MTDEIRRCSWAVNDLLIAYHDQEYGRLERDERSIYEKICLEMFSSGLSWYIALKKRPALRTTFADFDPDACAALSDAQLDQALQNPDIIRNRRKVYAVRSNARVIQDLRSEGGILQLIQNCPRPAELAAELRSRGMRQFGPVCSGELLKSLGLIPAHEPGCSMRGSYPEDSSVCPHS